MSLSQLPQEKRIIEKKELLKILMERALEVKEGFMKGGFLKKEFREKVPGGGILNQHCVPCLRSSSCTCSFC
ncbi:MAG: hypothetical protein NKF39_03830 [Tropheryma whipplei]|nr:hypothetical protein [Tropheryma whipplei]